MEWLLSLFPGIGTFFAVEPAIAVARIFLICFGFLLAYMGFQRKLEPLIMVPMGIGMICVNAGVLFLDGGVIGTLILDPLVSEPSALINILQINCLQPIYNLMFSNGLIACLVFMGIGARSEISFLLARPWTSITIALFAELGTFVSFIAGTLFLGLGAGQAAAIATIGGADGPMVLFSSLIMAPELFVPISIIAYLYLSLTYGGYPYLIRLLVPKKYRGIDVEVYPPEVPQKTKFIFIVTICAVLCLLLPMAAPLIMSFFIGVAIKEAEIGPYQEMLENGITYVSTFFLGLTLGALCEASTILNPVVIKILILGILALLISGIGGLLGGWVFYKINKGNFNPVIGIAGVSCVPTTAKLAQHAAEEENPFAMILPLAMGANISGVITSAIAAGVFITTISLVI
ncbi:Na+-transporting malonate decarboxylase, carboxybiotin decarboxylase subunit [Anaerotruncus rubiinfantis]|jgi:Na+-transporting malonate decarboxylase carboxybiotin decarboxylase subunit|uniref:Na+-transporting malonate decarboxylase, carboxybiotin decarboxylase subunit n=1 Tax=Anaerotruncus rubiinfantis TaxID=1720200 RepID=UPI0008319F93|nr:Na+-transporting malonate decarboxylase, carboxybiotin decarboxylase subunit [Anaerotruncus rubiinfantis]